MRVKGVVFPTLDTNHHTIILPACLPYNTSCLTFNMVSLSTLNYTAVLLRQDTLADKVRKIVDAFVDSKNGIKSYVIGGARTLYADLNSASARRRIVRGLFVADAKSLLNTMLDSAKTREGIDGLAQVFRRDYVKSDELALDATQQVAVAKMASITFFVTIVTLAVEIAGHTDLDQDALKELTVSLKAEQVRMMPLMEALQALSDDNLDRAVELCPHL